MRKVYTPIKDELDEKFSFACIKRHLSRPKGVIAAIEMWINAGAGTTQTREGENPIAAGHHLRGKSEAYRLLDRVAGTRWEKEAIAILRPLAKLAGETHGPGSIPRLEVGTRKAEKLVRKANKNKKTNPQDGQGTSGSG